MRIHRKTHRGLGRLQEVLKGKAWLLIVMQDNPDPDSIAAALALRRLANALTDTKCSIAHAGTIGRAENRALVEYLDLNLHSLAQVDLSRFDAVALVDAQPATGNCALPTNVLPDIVFDHHPLRRQTREVPFHDVRRHYGAASTILAEYLLQARVEIDIPLATALFYGVRSDTQDLGREATAADVEALESLYPLVNKRILSAIQRGRVPRTYFLMLAHAIENARVYGKAIVTTLGPIENPDMIGEVADLLLRAEGTECTCCMGLVDGRLCLSVRTAGEALRADLVVRQVVARRGTGGGHLTYAGAQIPLKKDSAAYRTRVEATLRGRFLRAVGADPDAYQRLTSPPKETP